MRTKNSESVEQLELFPGLLDKLERDRPLTESDLVGRGAARGRGKSKKRVAAPAGDRAAVLSVREEMERNSLPPPETPEQLGNGLRSRDSRTKSPSPGETPEQPAPVSEPVLESHSRTKFPSPSETPEQERSLDSRTESPTPPETPEQLGNGLRSPDSRTKSPTPPETPEQLGNGLRSLDSRTDSAPPSDIAPPAQTPEQPQNQAGKGIENTSMTDSAPAGGSVLESHSRTDTAQAEFPPIHPGSDLGWNARGWFDTQYKWLDQNGNQHTSNKYPSVPCSVKVNGPYITFCYRREGRQSDKKEYLGKPGSPRYRNFVRHWKQCQTVNEAIAFFNKQPDAGYKNDTYKH